MLHPPGFYYVKKPKRFVILSSDKSSERNLSCCFDIIKPRRIENLQSEEPFSSDPYFRNEDPILFIYPSFWPWMKGLDVMLGNPIVFAKNSKSVFSTLVISAKVGLSSNLFVV